MKNKVVDFLLLGNQPNPTFTSSRAKEFNVTRYAAKLGSNCMSTDKRIVVGCYELRVVICNYQIYPITAESRTPQETFTTRVDPVSAPLVYTLIICFSVKALRPQGRAIVCAKNSFAKQSV